MSSDSGGAPPTLRTQRLLLRAPVPTDVDPLFAIQGDPERMRFTWCAPDRDATRAFLASYARRFALDGFAPWTAVWAEEDRVIGWGGLNRDPTAPQWGIEVAYFVDPAFAGRGVATELVGAALAHGFDDLGLPRVEAFVRPQNGASVRVLEKAGLVRVRHVAELHRDRYRIGADAWRRRAAS